jgi:dipeptidase
MKNQDIRWMQRFQNYRQALARLSEAVALSRQRALSELEEQGLIQAFEFTHELAWNVLKDYLEAAGLRRRSSVPKTPRDRRLRTACWTTATRGWT